jgi:hypothetical protein
VYRVVGPHPVSNRVGENPPEQPNSTTGCSLPAPNPCETALSRGFGPSCRFTRRDVVHEVFNILARNRCYLHGTDERFDMSLNATPVD